jgi:proteasome maturation protein
VLQGTDETLDAADFMSGGADLREVLDVSAAMERSRGM